jgi:hypothetical protein
MIRLSLVVVLALASLARADQPRDDGTAKTEKERAFAAWLKKDAAYWAKIQAQMADMARADAAENAELQAKLAKIEADDAARRAKTDPDGTVALFLAELDKEASSAQHEAVEQALKLYPAELLKTVEDAYRDDKLTVLEAEVVREAREKIEKLAAKARTKAKIQELRAQKP